MATPNDIGAERKLAETIRGIRVAMLTTAAPDGALRSRPMATQQVEDGEDLWFFTKEHSGKVEEVKADAHVNLAYADPESQRYVSVTGKATLVREATKIKELWRDEYQAWFPSGLQDPELALLRVRVEHAEFWDKTTSGMVRI